MIGDRQHSLGRRKAHRPRRLSDGGYVLALSGLLLVPLLAFTGLAVDLGAWYARAAELQRAVDAAALAGVTALPQGETPAVDMAIAVLRQNGFDVDDPDIDFSYSQPAT